MPNYGTDTAVAARSEFYALMVMNVIFTGKTEKRRRKDIFSCGVLLA